MDIDLGWLGKVYLQDIEPEEFEYESFIIHMRGYTDTTIPVYGVTDDSKWNVYPTTWRNAILIKVKD